MLASGHQSCDVCPDDSTRVVLSGAEDYINASHIVVSTDVTIIEIEIEIAILTENRIELKSNFSCIPSNNFSIEALDRL